MYTWTVQHSTPLEALKGGGEPDGVKVRLLKYLHGKVKGKPGKTGQSLAFILLWVL